MENIEQGRESNVPKMSILVVATDAVIALVATVVALAIWYYLIFGDPKISEMEQVMFLAVAAIVPECAWLNFIFRLRKLRNPRQ